MSDTQQTEVPNLTPAQIVENPEEIKLTSGLLEQDQFKNNRVGLLVGPTPGLTFECAVYSHFGVSKFIDDKGKVALSFKVALDQNPDVKALTDVVDGRLTHILHEKKDVCFPQNDMMNEKFIQHYFKGLARRPKDEAKFEKYGYSMSGSIGPGTQFHKTTKKFRTVQTPEGPKKIRLVVPVTVDDLIGTKANGYKSKGQYKVTYSIPHIQLKEPVGSAVIYARSICYQEHLNRAKNPYNDMAVATEEEIAAMKADGGDYVSDQPIDKPSDKPVEES